MTTEVMPADTRLKVFEIRCRSKTGGQLTSKELKYLTTCLSKWPDCYKAMNAEIREVTKPFGAR